MKIPEQAQLTPPSLADVMRELARRNCRLIPLRELDKLPMGKWQDPNGDLPPQGAIGRVKSGFNYGVVPGEGVLLIDADGEEANEKVRAAFPDLQPTAKTPRGYHYWIACPAGQTIAGLGIEQAAGDTLLGAGIDLRTPGKGYGVGPGSRLDLRGYKGKTPPPGEPPWEYELIGGVSEVSCESLAQLRKASGTAERDADPDPTPDTDPDTDPDGEGFDPEEAGGGKSKIVALRPGLGLDIGERDAGVFKLAASLFDFPRLSYNAALRRIREAAQELIAPNAAEPFTDKELVKCVKSALKAADENRPAWMGKRGGVFFQPLGNPTDDFRARLNALSVQVSYNERDQRMEIKRGKGDWQHGNDAVASLYVNLDADAIPYPYIGETRAGKAFIFPKVKHLAQQEFKAQLSAAAGAAKRDPVLERLRELAGELDEKRKRGELSDDELSRYLPAFMEEHFIIDEGYERAAQYALIVPLCGVVRRALAPGCQHDITPLLIGPMGIGKSTLWRCLVFEPGQFSDGVRFNTLTDPRASAEQTEGAAIVELSEMAAVRRSDVDTTLGELTRCRTPRHRPAYKAQTEARPYRHVYVGTANRADSVPTVNGENRRLLPVMLSPRHGPDNQAHLQEALADPAIFNLAWQAAIFLALDGAKDPANGDFTGSRYQAMLPDIEKEARRLTPEHRQGEDRELTEILKAWRRDMEAEHQGKGWPFGELIEWMKKEQYMAGKSHYERIIREDWQLKAALKGNGWEQGNARFKGVSVWSWKPPKDAEQGGVLRDFTKAD